MATQYVKIHGLKELTARLKRLPAEIQKRVLRPALGKGAQEMKRAAIRFTPGGGAPYRPSTRSRLASFGRQTGTLARAAIVKFIRRESNETQAKYIVTYRRGKRFQARISKKGRRLASSDAFYASWVEFGHRIVPRVRRVGRDRRGRFVNSRTIRSRRSSATGRVAGRRMLTRAFAQTGRQVLDVIVNGIRANFDKAVQAIR